MQRCIEKNLLDFFNYANYKNLYSQAVNAAWTGLFPSYFVAFP